MINGVTAILKKGRRTNGEHPIYLRVTEYGKAKLISLGFTTKLEDWNMKKGLVKKTHPLQKELNGKIKQAVLLASKAKVSTTFISSRTILEQAIQKESAPIGILAYFTQTIERLKAENRHGYASAFRSSQLSLTRMLPPKHQDIQFTDLTPQFLRNWESQMKQNGNVPGTISLYMRNLRTILGYARLEKLTKVQPFSGEDKFSMTKYNTIETRKRGISKEAVEAIRTYPVQEGSPEFHVRNYFLFSLYTRGSNLTDIAHLTLDNRKGDYLEYRRRKTRRWQQVYLLEPAREIWDWYVESMKPGQQTVFWFILGHNNSEGQYKTKMVQRSTVDDPQKVRIRIQTVMKQINKILRKMAGELGIDQYMTTYVARHSFASILKAQGVSTDQISQLLNHDSVLTTKIYLEQFPDEVLEDAVRKLL